MDRGHDVDIWISARDGLDAERGRDRPRARRRSRLRAGAHRHRFPGARAWPDLPDRLQGVLAGRRDVDTCAHQNPPQQAMFVVEVALPDGRSASRSVARKEDVVATLEALLLLPLPEARPPEAAPVRAANPGARATARQAEPSPVESRSNPGRVGGLARAAPEARGWFRLEFSLAAGARLGDGQVGAASARDVVRPRGWLVGFEGATQQYGPWAAARARRRWSWRCWPTAVPVRRHRARSDRGAGAGDAWSRKHGRRDRGNRVPPTRGRRAGRIGQSKRLVCGARVTFQGAFGGPHLRRHRGRRRASGDPRPPFRRGRRRCLHGPSDWSSAPRWGAVSARRSNRPPGGGAVLEPSDPEI